MLRKGDLFQKGTSPTIYMALKDETVRGWVHCTAPYISVASKYKFNSNEDARTTYTEEGK